MRSNARARLALSSFDDSGVSAGRLPSRLGAFTAKRLLGEGTEHCDGGLVEASLRLAGCYPAISCVCSMANRRATRLTQAFQGTTIRIV